MKYQVTTGKKFQVVLRKNTSRGGIVEKKFFESEDSAYAYADANPHLCADVLNLEYFKAV